MDATTDRHEDKHVRVEDNVLVRGRGRYMADAPLPNQAYAHFVRSPHAAAKIVKVDTAAAEKAPGVIGHGSRATGSSHTRPNRGRYIATTTRRTAR